MLLSLLSLVEDEHDRRKFTELYNSYHTRMEKAAMRYLHEQADVEDAVQNAFIQVIQKFEKVYEIPSEELLYWLLSIVKTEAWALYRRRMRKPVFPLEEWADFAEEEDQMDYRSLVALFQKLPEVSRGVLEMKLLLGYTDREVAQRLGISETAVSSRANRGRVLLRKLAQKEGFHT